MIRAMDENKYVICPPMTVETDFRSYPYRWYILSVSCFLALSNAAIWISYSTVATHVQLFYCLFENFKFNGTLLEIHEIENVKSDIVELGHCEVSFWTNQIFQIVGTVFGLAGIVVTDKYGIRISVYCGAVTNLIGISLRTLSAWPALSESWRLGLLYTGQTIAAIAQPFFLVLSPKIAEFWFSDHQRALANALSFAANPAGVVLGTLAPELIVDKITMRNDYHLFHLNALLLFLAIVVMTMALGIRSDKPPTPPSASSASNNSPPFLEGLLKLFRIPSFYILVVTFGMSFALCWGFFMAIEPMMKALKYEFVGYAGALAAIAGFISSITAGYYVDQSKRFKEVLKGCTIGIAVVAIGIDVYLRHRNNSWFDSPILGLLMVLLGFFAIPVFPIGLELGIETTYPIAEASSSGILTIASQLMLFMVAAIVNNVPRLNWFYPARNQNGHESNFGDLVFEQNYQLAVDAWMILCILTAVFTCGLLWPRYKRVEYELTAMAHATEEEST
uniref:Major facilitator superfamily (MFS) profile domain-containing protein n=1 Tax=Panagrolaimus sp. JU765 TaxID=591449 RepID=A0AC34QCR4_9BILA